MTPFPTDHDLIAHVMGRLDPPQRERVERALVEKPDLAAQRAEIEAHLALYDVLPPAPPPPPFSRIAAQLADEPTAPRRLAPSVRWAAAVVVLAVAIGALVLSGTGPDPTPDPALAYVRAGLTVERAGRLVTEVPGPDDVLSGAPRGSADLVGRGRVALDEAARLRLVERGHVALERGRAWFSISGGPLRVETPRCDVVVKGTEFEVAVSTDRVDVLVGEGSVEVDGTTVRAGEAWSAGDLRTVDPSAIGAWYRRPTLGLHGPDAVVAGRDVRLVFELVNVGRLPLAITAPGGPRATLWLSVTSPSGAVADLRVSGAADESGPLAPGRSLVLRAGESRRLTASFADAFDEPGPYRCRAMYRPQQDESPVISPILNIEVR